MFLLNIYVIALFAGHEDSVSLASSLISLAERGTATPARQRTVTEVIWPEQMSGLNNGHRSRLSSSTSLFRAGSQKSIAGTEAGVNYALSRRDSQRSVAEWAKPLYVSVGNSASGGGRQGGGESVMGSPSASTPGWRSEQGSPRRPASLILTADHLSHPQDWLAANRPTRGNLDNAERGSRTSVRLVGGDGTPQATASPSVQHRRFCTTQVELLPEQVNTLD